MSWIVLSAALTFGYLPQASSFGGVMDTSKPCFEQTLSFEAVMFGHLRVATELETRDTTDDGIGWHPYQSRYRVKAEAFTKGIKVGGRHECIHPTLSSDRRENRLLTQETELYVMLELTNG
jgi:hypothetical protein